MFRELIKSLGADVPLLSRERALQTDARGPRARLCAESRKTTAGRHMEKGRKGGSDLPFLNI